MQRCCIGYSGTVRSRVRRCQGALATAPSAGASRPSRRVSGCSTRPPGCSSSAATRAPASPPSQKRRACLPRRSTRAFRTSARCSPSSFGAPFAARTRAPVLEQAGPLAVAAATDQHEQLRLFAADIVLRLERAAPLVAIVAGASRSEPELAKLLTRLHAYRRDNLRGLVDALAGNGPLRLPTDEAVDTVWALTSPELHQLLSRERGWTRRRYRDWLADSLALLLLNREQPALMCPPPAKAARVEAKSDSRPARDPSARRTPGGRRPTSRAPAYRRGCCVKAVTETFPRRRFGCGRCGWSRAGRWLIPRRPVHAASGAVVCL